MSTKTNAPVIIWHSRHPMLAAVRAALSAYRIVHVNSYHTSKNVAEVWRDIRLEAHIVPDVIMTVWDHAPLRALISSTTIPANILVSGGRCKIVKTVMMPDDPGTWSGSFKEHYFNAEINHLCVRVWLPVGKGE